MSFYSIPDVNLQVECEDNRLAKMVTGAIDEYFYLTKGSSDSHFCNILLRFKNNDFSTRAPESAQELSASSHLRVLKDGDFCYLVSGDSVFQLDLRNSTGIGLLGSGFWEIPLKCRQDFLMLSLLWLLRPHGLYALHANGLVKDKTGVLILGDTGSGKSTTALSLIRQGWGYLSDDVVLVRQSPNGVEALALQKGFSFDQNLADHFPELNKPIVSPVELPLEVSHLNGQKRFLDINPIYPDRFTFSCFPEVLIFPKIVSQDKSRLAPVDRTRALILLAENSGGIMVDKGMVTKQMEVLKRLVYQTSSYRLLAGRDLYEEPERISEVLSAVGVIPS